MQDQDNNSVMLDGISNETDSIVELNTSDEEIDLVADESLSASKIQDAY